MANERYDYDEDDIEYASVRDVTLNLIQFTRYAATFQVCDVGDPWRRVYLTITPRDDGMLDAIVTKYENCKPVEQIAILSAGDLPLAVGAIMLPSVKGVK